MASKSKSVSVHITIKRSKSAMDNSVDMIHENYAMGDCRGERDQGRSVVNYVKDLVNNHKVVVFSKTQCPHCTDSKTLLSGLGVQYTSVELDEMSHGPQVQNVLGQMTDARTVPRIFIDGHCVGGNSDLQSLDREGILKEMLAHNKDAKPGESYYYD